MDRDQFAVRPALRGVVEFLRVKRVVLPGGEVDRHGRRRRPAGVGGVEGHRLHLDRRVVGHRHRGGGLRARPARAVPATAARRPRGAGRGRRCSGPPHGRRARRRCPRPRRRAGAAPPARPPSGSRRSRLRGGGAASGPRHFSERGERERAEAFDHLRIQRAHGGGWVRSSAHPLRSLAGQTGQHHRRRHAGHTDPRRRSRSGREVRIDPDHRDLVAGVLLRAGHALGPRPSSAASGGRPRRSPVARRSAARR